jgi:hypothetical protein
MPTSLRALSAPTRSEKADAQYARGKAHKAKADKVDRRKFNGRKKGSINKKTIEKMALAEREIAASNRGTKYAIDHMDDMIGWFRDLVAKLVPFDDNGIVLKGRDPKIWFRAVECFQGFLNMRAPYQSARLSAVAIMPQQAQQRTTVNVTILNERGEKVYSDSDDPSDDAKVIEHMPADGEAA